MVLESSTDFFCASVNDASSEKVFAGGKVRYLEVLRVMMLFCRLNTGENISLETRVVCMFKHFTHYHVKIMLTHVSAVVG